MGSTLNTPKNNQFVNTYAGRRRRLMPITRFTGITRRLHLTAGLFVFDLSRKSLKNFARIHVMNELLESVSK